MSVSTPNLSSTISSTDVVPRIDTTLAALGTLPLHGIEIVALTVRYATGTRMGTASR